MLYSDCHSSAQQQGASYSPYKTLLSQLRENSTFCSTSLFSLYSHLPLPPRLLISLIALSSFRSLSISVRNDQLWSRTRLLSPAVSAIVTIIHFPLCARYSLFGILGSCFMSDVGRCSKFWEASATQVVGTFVI